MLSESGGTVKVFGRHTRRPGCIGACRPTTESRLCRVVMVVSQQCVHVRIPVSVLSAALG